MIPCSQSCCYAADCACIRCDSFSSSLTSSEFLKTRYICTECELAFSEDLNNFTFQVLNFTVCETCFASDNIKHEHKQFCRINSLGEHMLVKRRAGFAVVQKLCPEDLPTISSTMLGTLSEASRYCQCCQVDFSEDNLAVSTPGCMHAHGLPLISKNDGVADSMKHMCEDCAFQYYKSISQDTYCDISRYCMVCQNIRKEQIWRTDFKSEAEMAFLEGGVEQLIIKMNDLKKLHLQSWVQKIIDEEFEYLLVS